MTLDDVVNYIFLGLISLPNQFHQLLELIERTSKSETICGTHCSSQNCDSQCILWFPLVYSGSVIITSLRNIVKTEGLRGLYRGLSPTIVALLPNWAVSFFLCLFPEKKGLKKPQLMDIKNLFFHLLSPTIALA